MISTFDLTLLGSMVSTGGLALLCQRQWPHLRLGRLIGGNAGVDLPAERCDAQQRSTALAGARWLTVGLLTLFIAFAHGAETGYLFGPWTDVMFHFAFVSTCWATTLYRINHTALHASTPFRRRRPGRRSPADS